MKGYVLDLSCQFCPLNKTWLSTFRLWLLLFFFKLTKPIHDIYIHGLDLAQQEINWEYSIQMNYTASIPVPHYCYSQVRSVQFNRSVMFNSLPPYGRQATLSITNSRSLLRFMSIKLVMPSNHLTLCCTLLLLPSIFPNIRVFSNESVLHSRWPKYWNISFSISLSSEYLGLKIFRTDFL